MPETEISEIETLHKRVAELEELVGFRDKEIEDHTEEIERLEKIEKEYAEYREATEPLIEKLDDLNDDFQRIV